MSGSSLGISRQTTAQPCVVQAAFGSGSFPSEYLSSDRGVLWLRSRQNAHQGASSRSRRLESLGQPQGTSTRLHGGRARPASDHSAARPDRAPSRAPPSPCRSWNQRHASLQLAPWRFRTPLRHSFLQVPVLPPGQITRPCGRYANKSLPSLAKWAQRHNWRRPDTSPTSTDTVPVPIRPGARRHLIAIEWNAPIGSDPVTPWSARFHANPYPRAICVHADRIRTPWKPPLQILPNLRASTRNCFLIPLRRRGRRGAETAGAYPDLTHFEVFEKPLVIAPVPKDRRPRGTHGGGDVIPIEIQQHPVGFNRATMGGRSLVPNGSGAIG